MTLGWNLKICIYNKFPGDADAPHTEPLWESLAKNLFLDHPTRDDSLFLRVSESVESVESDKIRII